MVEKILYLHLGLHKTGTTSLQNILANNKNKLLKQGFCYPIEKYINSNHSTCICSIFSNNPISYWKIRGKIMSIKTICSVNKHIKDFLHKILKNNNKVIISGEGISKLNVDELIKLRNFFHSYNFKIKPIIVIRSPYSSICSMFSHVIKNGKYIPLNNLENLDFNQNLPIKKIKNICSVFKKENIKFFSYHNIHSTSKYGTSYIIMKYIGINYDKFSLLEIKNVSNSNYITRVLNQSNKMQIDIPKGHLIDNLNSDKFYLTENELKNIRGILDKCNNYFNKTFGSDYIDKDYPISKEINKEIIDEIIKNYIKK